MNVSLPSVESILIAAVFSIVLSLWWYSPMMFGGAWRVLATMHSKKLYSDMMAVSPARFIGALVQAYVLAHLLAFTNSRSVVEGLTAGFWIWLGFVATTAAAEYSSERRPLSLLMINLGFRLVDLLLMGLLLVVLQPLTS